MTCVKLAAFASLSAAATRQTRNILIQTRDTHHIVIDRVSKRIADRVLSHEPIDADGHAGPNARIIAGIQNGEWRMTRRLPIRLARPYRFRSSFFISNLSVET